MGHVAAIQALAGHSALVTMDELRSAIPTVDLLIAQFIESAAKLGALEHYKVFPPAARDIVTKIANQHDAGTVRRFLRAVILTAIQGTVASARYRQLPPRTAANQTRHLLRMAGDTRIEEEWLSVDQDVFHKEFGLATMRLYACGSQLVDPRCGVPRSTVLRTGMAGALPKLLTMAGLGGFRPYFQIHTHKFNLDTFNEAGWDECYLCCAELYDVHPEVLGMYGSSWFYDPALATISPRLAYLRDVPCANGAKLMFVMKGGEAIGNSTATSPSRKKLYDEGKYMPSNYMMIWGRTAQRAWAKTYAGQAG